MLIEWKSVELQIVLLSKCKLPGANREVFPTFHRVFHRNHRRCNIQQLSTGFGDSRIFFLQFVITRFSNVLELKLITKNTSKFHVNDKFCTAIPPAFSTDGGIAKIKTPG